MTLVRSSRSPNSRLFEGQERWGRTHLPAFVVKSDRIRHAVSEDFGAILVATDRQKMGQPLVSGLEIASPVVFEQCREATRFEKQQL